VGEETNMFHVAAIPMVVEIVAEVAHALRMGTEMMVDIGREA
jgi:hypothetical protein